MISLVGLAVFSGLSLNLLLQFALGVGDIVRNARKKNSGVNTIPFYQFFILFISVLFLWVFFNYITPVSWRGFSEYFLFFPLSVLVCLSLEFLAEKLFFKNGTKLGFSNKIFSSITAYDGLIPASLIITFAAAESFSGALILVFFFTIGNLMGLLILMEIRRRSTLEWVPKHLKGSPIIIISMGLLSLIFVSAAGIFFKILEAF